MLTAAFWVQYTPQVLEACYATIRAISLEVFMELLPSLMSYTLRSWQFSMDILEVCWNKGFRNVVCFSDSLQAVTLVKEGVSPFHSFANELQKICQLRSRAWTVLFEHTFREGNRCADHLAKLGAASTSSLVIISVPPLELTSLLQADAEGVSIVTCEGVVPVVLVFCFSFFSLL
jgi:hypothetical protein